MLRRVIFILVLSAIPNHTFARGGPNGGQLLGRVTDETGGVLPGVTVELRSDKGAAAMAVTSAVR